MKPENPLSDYIQLSCLSSKHFDSQLDTAQSIMSALEVLDNKLSGEALVEAEATQIAKALTTIIYMFGGCLVHGKYQHHRQQHIWEASSIVKSDVYGDMLLKSEPIADPSSYVQMMNDLDTRLMSTSKEINDDADAAQFVNDTIRAFDSRRRQ